MTAALKDLFAEPISDEAVYALHILLHQFAAAYEDTHYEQIQRHYQSLMQQEVRTDSSGCDIPF